MFVKNTLKDCKYSVIRMFSFLLLLLLLLKLSRVNSETLFQSSPHILPIAGGTRGLRLFTESVCRENTTWGGRVLRLSKSYKKLSVIKELSVVTKTLYFQCRGHGFNPC